MFWISEFPERRTIYISPAYEKLWGLNPQDVYNNYRSWIDLIHPDDKEATERAFQEKAAAGKFDQEYRIILPDGTLRWVRDRCFPIYDASGKMYRLTGIAEDITQRKRSVQALQESEERFRTSVENMIDCFGIYRSMRDEQGQIIDFRTEYLNDAACLSNQMTREQQIGRGLCELLPRHRDSGLFDEYRQVVETGQSLVKENLVYEDNYGQQRLIRAFDIRIAKLGDGFVATWRDITDRKHTEQALQESETRLKLAHQATRSGLWDWNVSGNSAHVSEEYCNIFGLNPTIQDVSYEQWLSWLHPDDRPSASEAVIRVIQQQQKYYETDYRILHPDGIRWIASRGQVFYDEKGNAVRMLGNVQDITKRKQTEAALKLSEAKLQSFADANVIGMLFGDIYGGIYEANDEFLRIVGYTRDDLHSGKLRWDAITPDEHLPIDAKHIAEAQEKGACTPYEKEYLRKDGSRVPVLLGYSLLGENREESVVFIIDLTARKAAEVERDRLLQQEQAARAEAERANRIKDEFLAILSHELRSPLNPILGWSQLLRGNKKLDETMVTKGLVVELHGGTVTAESSGEGQGATFTVQLPLFATHSKSIVSETPSAELTSDLKNLRILVVDDDPSTREFLVFALEQYGAIVTAASGAKEALMALSNNKFDILLSDIGMPEIDGYTLIRQIRTSDLDDNKQIPAIALTAYASDRDRQKAKESGFQNHIAKPVNLTELVKLINAGVIHNS